MSEAADDSTGSEDAERKRLEALPGSARRVHTALTREGPLTHKELVEVTEMPARTVRFAVARLRDEGLLGERRNLMDSRQSFFYLHAGEDEPRRAL